MCALSFLRQLILLAEVVQTMDKDIRPINHQAVDESAKPGNCAIQWIVIYMVHSVIHLLNNWDLVTPFSFPFSFYVMGGGGGGEGKESV